MSDRTSVSLTFLAVHYDQVVSFYEADWRPYDIARNGQEYKGVSLSHLYFEDVNYGTLPYLDKLSDLGIAYSTSWDQGDEYDSGTDKALFNKDGELIEVSYDDGHLRLDHYVLKGILKLTTGQLAEIKARVNQMDKLIEQIPWETQEEYGKRYRALKLIGA
jgi:hypothetical protein